MRRLLFDLFPFKNIDGARWRFQSIWPLKIRIRNPSRGEVQSPGKPSTIWRMLTMLWDQLPFQSIRPKVYRPLIDGAKGLVAAWKPARQLWPASVQRIDSSTTKCIKSNDHKTVRPKHTAETRGVKVITVLYGPKYLISALDSAFNFRKKWGFPEGFSDF